MSGVSATLCRLRAGALRAVAVSLCGALFVVGCGDDDSDDSQSSSANAGTSQTDAKAPTGKPIVLADISDVTGSPGSPFGEFAVGEQAAIDYINKELGGLDGRPFELWTCDAKLDPAATVACANNGVAEKPIASVGLALNWAENGLKIWTKAGIPSLHAPVAPGDCTNPLSFPLVGGTFAEAQAQGRWLATDKKPKSVAYVGLDSPPTRAQADLTGGTLSGTGIKYTKAFFPLTAADLTPAVQSAVGSKPELVLVGTAGAQYVQVLKILAQSGYEPSKTLSTSPLIDVEKALKPAGAAANGAYFTYPFKSFDDKSDPQVKTYLDAMEKYAPKESPRAVFAQWGFANVMTLYEAGKEIGPDKLDAAALEKYLADASDVPVFMSDRLLAASEADKRCPSVRNPSVQIVQWLDGEVKSVTELKSALEQ